MAVLREANLLGQQRIDVPHLRAIESAVCADFDVVAGRSLAGGQPLVVTGFQLGNASVGTVASSIQLSTASSILFNVNASQSGTFLWLQSSQPVDTLNPATNANVTGSWTSGQANYIGIDLNRTALASTADLVQFIDPDTLIEDPKDVPLGLVMGYIISISTTPFSAQPNLVPIAIVTLDGSGQVASNGVQDARNLMYRLGTGGDSPNALYAYPWPQQRFEVAGSFTGGDKALGSLRDFIQAIETRVWEIGGGENWYSPTADRNVFMSTSGAGLGSGVWFNWDGTYLTWAGITFTFDNSDEAGVYYNTVSDNTGTASVGMMNDGDCIYVDLVRSSNTNLTALRTPLQTLGTPTIPGSRQVIAVRVGTYVFTRGSVTPVGYPVPVATTTTLGIVKLNQTSATPLAPIVVNLGTNNNVTWSASGGNADALDVTGNGTGSGVHGTGGATNGAGVSGTGSGSGAGISGTGGGTNGSGVVGTGTAGGYGGYFTGGATGAGIAATGGATSGRGGTFTGGGTTGNTNYGVYVTGGPSSAGDASDAGYFTGGLCTSSGSSCGRGISAYGGTATSGNIQGGGGIYAQGGDGHGSSDGGAGVYGKGGAGGGGGTAGPGGRFLPASGTADDAIDSQGYINMGNGTQPSSSTGFSNKITKKNVCKCWAYLTPAGGGNPPITGDGFNVNAPALTGTTRCDITFATALSSADYSVQITIESAAGNIYVPVILSSLKSGSGFSFEVVLIGSPGGAYAGTLLNLGFSTDYTVNITVFGAQ